jgi:8-oxo-dGTP pyrophosphatase MutT (NUDIX family)
VSTDDRARRAALSALLAGHAPHDQEERDAIAVLARLLVAQDDPMRRETLPAHVTASAVVLDPGSGRALLHRHRRLGIWLQPGGHVEDGEHAADAALRETREETGLNAAHLHGATTIGHVDEHLGPDGHVHLDVRFVLQWDADLPSSPAEPSGLDGDTGPRLRWVDRRQAAELSDRSFMRALDATLARLRD